MITEQERKNLESLSNEASSCDGKIIKEYRAIEGDYRAIVRYNDHYDAGIDVRYTVTGDTYRRM